MTIPAGQTGIVGIYLQPNPGQPIPPPGTQLSFTVTATSTTDPSITQTQTETFTVPEIDAVTLTSDPSSVNTTPGTPVADTITLANAGNVPETVSLAATLPSGLTASALTPVTLAVGQSTTETITLTPDASTPLNSTLDATITATFGPSASPQTQTVQIPVSVVVPGAAAIANAAVAAGQLGNTNLADRLNDLSIALTNLFQNPTSQVYMSQSSASLDAVINLLTTDPYLGTFAPTLTADGAALAQATTASAIQTALAQLGTDLGTVGTTLTDEAAHGFNFTLLTNSQVGQPQVAKTYGIVVQNTGSQTTTYDLSLSGVPSGVTASLSQTSVTLAPGQATSVSGAVTNLSVTITSNSTTQIDAFTFTVQATAEGATEISRTTTGSFTARTAVVQVVSVTPNPAFTNPGGQVDVSARILNAVNQQQQAEVSYTVTDPSGKVVFTSQPVAITLNVLSTLTPADLGNLDTTNFADGEFTINVTVTDSSGNPIPGATGQGSLLVGSPVTATLSSSPAMLPAGNGTVTNTLQINSSLATGGQFTLEGQTPIAGGASTVAIYGHYAYVGESNGINIVDVSNPADPSVVSTFGSSDFPGGLSSGSVRVSGDELLVDSASSSKFLVYSLANPTSPQLLGSTNLNLYAGDNGFVVQNTNAYLSQWYFEYYTFSGSVFAQFGDLFSVDFSNPSSPSQVGSLYGLSTGGSSFVFGAAVVNSNTLLVASTTSTGANSDGGEGQVLVVGTSNPSDPTLLGTVNIPGTIHLEGIAVDGNQAVVIGSSGGLFFNGSTLDFPGSLVLATLDLTNPQSPRLIATQTFSIPYTFAGAIASLGNDFYVASSPGSGSTSSALLLIDAQNPSNIQVTPFDVANAPNDDEVSGNLLYTTSSDGLLIYNIAPATSAPITAQVTVPTNNGVSIDASSFSIAPTSITTNSNNTETIEWDLDLPLGSSSQTITWQSDVTGLQPGQSLTVDQGATVQFTDQGTPGTLTLPAQFVTGQQIIGLSPPTQAVAPAAPATYDVTLLNPTNSQVTYDLSIQGVPASWVNLRASVTVAANGSDDVPLVLTSDSFAALADYGFTITANGGNGAVASVLGDLVLQGQPVLPDPDSHGIVATLTPTQATAGQGTSAQYVVQLTNTGSADDTFTLTATGLPPGVAATFGQTTIDVPPGASNFRDVTLTLTPPPGTTPGDDPFQVTATSTTKSTVSNTASGTLAVLGNGVAVTLNPSSGTPGSSFQMTVTNTGQVEDTFDLSLGGPAAAVASLGSTTQVTLAPGASQQVTITTGAVNFADPGALNLVAIATTEGNPAVAANATATLSIASTKGLTAQYDNASQTLAAPGTSSFLLLVNNTGNTEDAYTATILGTSGPITASLSGLDGQPTQTIPIFRLPGLFTGAILLQTSLSASGQGTVTVQVKSLSSSLTASASATVTTTAASKAVTTTSLTASPGPYVYGQSLTFTATVSPVTPGLPTPSGTVQFEDGNTVLDTETLVGGKASFSTAALTAGSHTITAVYSGDTSYNTSTATNPPQIVVAKATPTVSVTWSGWTYDGTPHAANGLVSGIGTPTFTYYAAASVAQISDANKLSGAPKDAGTYTVLASYAGGTNYNPASNSATITISPAPLTASGITANNKVYDGTKVATLNTGNAALVGVFSGDSVTLNTGSATGTFTSKDVANSITVSVAGLTISGAQAGDYTLTQPTTTANITPATLTVSGITANNKVYDRTTTAILNTGNAALVGLFSGDSVTLNTGSATGTFASKNVANGITVTVAGLTLGGAQAFDYSLSQPTTTANIAALGITGSITVNNKVYDATKVATIATRTLSGVITGDTVSYVGGTAMFSDKNVGTVKTVTAAGLSLSGTDSGNYTVNSVATTTANITPAPLTVTATGVNKVYDGTTTATVTLSDNRVSGDVFTDSYTSAIFGSKDVGTGKTVTVSGISISGTDAGNYTFNTTASTAANITPAPLTITANNDSKTYGTLKTFSGTAFTEIGLVRANGDAISGVTETSTGAAVSATVGSYNIVPSAAAGTGLSNYTISYMPGTLSVTPAPLTITANNDSKTYGTLKTFSGTAFTQTGLVTANGDTISGVTETSPGSPASATVGSYNIVPSAATGSGLSNYSIGYVNGTLTVNLSPSGASIYVLDATAGGALNLSGNASINIAGNVVVDSNTSSAILATGNARVTAGQVLVVGGVSKSGNASVTKTGTPGAMGDPLAGLTAPTYSGSPISEILSGNSTATINPGVYSQITVSGNASLTMKAGVYIIEGGGFTESGNASIKGSGVTIYNTSNSGGSYGSITLSGNGSLSAATSGTYAGLLIFQDRNNPRALTLSGNVVQGMAGTIYAQKAQLVESGNVQLGSTSNPVSIVVDTLMLSGNAIANSVSLKAPTGMVAYTPAQIRAAYGINNLSLDGTGQTIAIVDAYDDPSIYPALDAFDSQFGLTPTGPTLYQQYGAAASFLRVLNQNGQSTSLPATDPSGAGTDNWEVEEALDVEWAHAIAPGAQIVLVEANGQSLSDLMAGVATAASQPGVSVVSMSWGFPEGQAVFATDEAAYDGVFNVPGVTFVASTGDYGAADPEYPAYSPKVVAVGGTSLTLNADGSHHSEAGWGYYSDSVAP